jgi:hypothetical protein
VKATLQVINQVPEEYMSEFMRKVLERKRERRSRLAQLPFSEKLALLEKLRDRSLLIARSPLRTRRQHQRA